MPRRWKRREVGQHPRLSSASSLTKRWRNFVERVDRRPNRDEYEAISAHRFTPLEIFQGGGKPSRLFFFTDEFNCRRLMLENEFPVGWHALVRYGVPPLSYLATIRQYAIGLGLPLLFVGSLNPHHLTVFATLRAGSADLILNPRLAAPIQYFGIDDRWLALCEEYLEPKLTFDKVTDKMGRLEREHLAFVLELIPDLKQLVGPRCFDLLTSGRGFPVIAASNPSFYRKGFGEALLRHLQRAQPRTGVQKPPSRRRGAR